MSKDNKKQVSGNTRPVRVNKGLLDDIEKLAASENRTLPQQVTHMLELQMESVRETV
ncbi:MAG: hypothetical protein HUJ30_00660 [Gammaproteobacteria bacterium]|nr:hypothetical protein [Gammaproteobacteria bacterium]